MYRIISLLIGYCLGMIQTSYIVGKASGIDIREHGSKNAGFTNTNRVLGVKKGAIVFVVDIFKAVAAFAIATLVYNHFFAERVYVEYPSYGLFSLAAAGGTFFATSHVLPGLYASIGAIIGHVFPAFLKFKGGKGVACVLGLVIMLDWRVMLISFAFGILAVVVTRFISVASLGISLFVVVLVVVLGYPAEVIALAAGLCVLIWFLHRDNIRRLLARQENKFSLKRNANN